MYFLPLGERGGRRRICQNAIVRNAWTPASSVHVQAEHSQVGSQFLFLWSASAVHEQLEPVWQYTAFHVVKQKSTMQSAAFPPPPRCHSTANHLNKQTSQSAKDKCCSSKKIRCPSEFILWMLFCVWHSFAQPYSPSPTSLTVQS